MPVDVAAVPDERYSGQEERGSPMQEPSTRVVTEEPEGRVAAVNCVQDEIYVGEINKRNALGWTSRLAGFTKFFTTALGCRMTSKLCPCTAVLLERLRKIENISGAYNGRGELLFLESRYR
jgi:hypothetical protein